MNSEMSLLGINHKKTGSKASGRVGNCKYEVLVVPETCSKLPNVSETHLNFEVCTEYVGFNPMGKAGCKCKMPPAGLALSATQHHCCLPSEFVFGTAFSLSHPPKLKSAWRENCSLTGKGRNES